MKNQGHINANYTSATTINFFQTNSHLYHRYFPNYPVTKKSFNFANTKLLT